jgi:hypothetical protein
MILLGRDGLPKPPQIPLAQVLKFEVRPNAEDDYARKTYPPGWTML